MPVDVKDLTQRTLTCMVSCSCHKVRGRAKLHVAEDMEVFLVYDVQGWFRSGVRDHLLYCQECSTAVMTVGEWVLG